MRAVKVITLILICLFSFLGQAQDNSAGTGPKARSLKSERKLRKEARKEMREKRKKEKAEKKAVKAHHKRIQTKKVRKRMKQSKRKSTRVNENKREFFLKRWFSKKKKVK